MSDIITINDSASILNPENNSEWKAVVRFIGSIEGQIGTFYGLDVNTSTSGNLIFVKRKEIIKFEPLNKLRVTVGDIVNIPKFDCHGIIRYIGNAKFKPDTIWYGIQLETPNGKNNGSVKGIKYFTCEDKYGIFVKGEFIQAIEKKKHKHKHSKKKKHGKLIKKAGELSKTSSTNSNISDNSRNNDTIPHICKYVKEENLKYWCNRDVSLCPDLNQYQKMRMNNISNDEIAEQMFQKNVPAYWINKFFLSENV